MRRLITKLSLSTILGLVLIIYTQAVCFAETDPTQGLADSEFNPGDSFDSFTMIVKVIFFLVLIILLFFVLIKYIARKNRGSFFGNSVRSLGGVPLGQNKSIQIVEIGHSLFVVGVGDNIQLLDKINDADEVAYITDLLTATHAQHQGIMNARKWLDKLPIGKREAEEEEITSSFQQVFHDKMQRVTNRNKNVEDWLSDQKMKDRLNDE
ncbi:flagellar biosynthetic protein FliO [Paenibacillus hexagrammi]|uniref:Flagellar biosynthetic protein FliO n=1 Tax=Paenibacillus hexagrammi TaxID=2908839 RepID=A0ABY3SPL0_9BACL|nr:flagellar biosynthetic protein FliO [Paenibacillus sp. YPD9-1]UJF35355.1 flagellar biosynthetic protein FliO [Paenibacillus sp. YPD9-1]